MAEKRTGKIRDLLKTFPLLIMAALIVISIIVNEEGLTGLAPMEMPAEESRTFGIDERISDENNNSIGRKTNDEIVFETFFTSIEKRETSLFIAFYHNASTEQPVWVEGSINYSLSRTIAEPFQNVTLIVPKVKGIVPKFKLHVGSASDIFEFGKTIPAINFEGESVLIDRSDEKIDLELTKEKSRIEIKGLNNEETINAKIIPASEPKIKTDIFAAESVTIDNATITTPKKGRINTILECAEFNTMTDSCPTEWTQTNIPFTENQTHITFTVNHFSGYAGAEINIINIQSYPSLYGNWTVMFNTTGTANLTIRASNGTTWSQDGNQTDLQFIEIKCGENILNYSWIDNSVFIQDYNCSSTSYETSKPLTTGKHTLEFTFGDDIKYAYNDVITSCGVTINTSTTLTSNLSNNGTCITIGNNSIELDCAGYTITGNGTAANAGKGINISDKTNITIKNCDLQRFRTGISLVNTNNSLIFNNSANGTYSGITLTTSRMNIILSNKMNSSYTTISVFGDTGDNVSNNVLRSDTDYGISLSGNDYTIQINRNNVSSSKYGIGLSALPRFGIVVNDVLIENSTIDNIEETGIVINSCSNITARLNTVTNASTGIQALESDTVNIVNNTIMQAGIKTVGTAMVFREAILLSSGSRLEKNTNIISNNIQNNDNGIDIWPTANNTVIENNTIINNTYTAIVALNSDYMVIRNNNFSNNAYSTEMHTWFNPVEAQATVYNASVAANIWLTLPANRLFASWVMSTGNEQNRAGMTDFDVYDSTGSDISLHRSIARINGKYIEASMVNLSQQDTLNFTIPLQATIYNLTGGTSTSGTLPTNWTLFVIPILPSVINIYLGSNTLIENNTFDGPNAITAFNTTWLQVYNNSQTGTGKSIRAINSLNLSLQDIELQDSEFEILNTGKINFTSNITVTNQRNITDIINMTPVRIHLNSLSAPEFNKSAILTFKNITHLNLVDPRPMADLDDDGTFEFCNDCAEISYTNNETFVYSVSHFTTYGMNETPIVNPPGGSRGGGGGMGGVIHKTLPCTESWTCNKWGPCIENTQIRYCIDMNNCGTAQTKPATTQECTTPITQQETIISETQQLQEPTQETPTYLPNAGYAIMTKTKSQTNQLSIIIAAAGIITIILILSIHHQINIKRKKKR